MNSGVPISLILLAKMTAFCALSHLEDPWEDRADPLRGSLLGAGGRGPDSPLILSSLNVLTCLWSKQKNLLSNLEKQEV